MTLKTGVVYPVSVPHNGEFVVQTDEGDVRVPYRYLGINGIHPVKVEGMKNPRLSVWKCPNTDQRVAQLLNY